MFKQQQALGELNVRGKREAERETILRLLNEYEAHFEAHRALLAPLDVENAVNWVSRNALLYECVLKSKF